MIAGFSMTVMHAVNLGVACDLINLTRKKHRPCLWPSISIRVGEPPQKGHVLNAIYDTPLPPPQNQRKLSQKKTVIQRRLFGFRLYEAPYMGGIGDHEPMRCKPLGVPGLRHLDSRVNFASHNKTLSVGGAIEESVFKTRF